MFKIAWKFLRNSFEIIKQQKIDVYDSIAMYNLCPLTLWVQNSEFS